MKTTVGCAADATVRLGAQIKFLTNVEVKWVTHLGAMLRKM